MTKVKGFLKNASIFSALFGVASLSWSLYETRHPKVREYGLRVLPKGTNPINVLHISDLHFRGEKSEWLKNWLKSFDLSNIDLVISTGDNLGAENVNDEVIDSLSSLLKLPGAFVFGSNDYYGPKKKNPFEYFLIKSPVDEENSHAENVVLDSVGLAKSFEEFGWLNLNNSCGVLELPQGCVELIGVDDPHIGRAVFPSLDFDSEDFNTHDSIVRLGLAHAPYLGVMAGFEERKCAVSFFGHTHGGQLSVPLFGALVSNCDLPPVFASGVFALRNIFKYVKTVIGDFDITVENVSDIALSSNYDDYKGFVSISAGLGTSPMIPLRFGCPPEVSVITLLPVEE